MDPETVYQEVKENAATCAGLCIGAGAHVTNKLADTDLISKYLNGWNGDKVLHFSFTYGLTRATFWATENASSALYTAADWSLQTEAAPYVTPPLTYAAAKVEDPAFSHKALAGAGALALFSVSKESLDNIWDWYDITANTGGYGIATAHEYREETNDQYE